MLANVGAIIGGIVFGHFSDRLGRRRMIIAALLLAIVTIPLWAFAPTIPLLIARRLPHAVHGAGRLGRDPGAHQRAVAELRARLSARLRVPVRRADRRRLSSTSSRCWPSTRRMRTPWRSPRRWCSASECLRSGWGRRSGAWRSASRAAANGTCSGVFDSPAPYTLVATPYCGWLVAPHPPRCATARRAPSFVPSIT